MGVNMVGQCIMDDKVVEEAAKQEVIRRYYNSLCELRKGNSEEEVDKQRLLLSWALPMTTGR